MAATLGVFYGILLIVIGIVQIGVGFMGIEYHLGALWAWLAIGIGFVLRIMLPLTIGTFFGALDVLGWPWYGALALTAPGLIFILPAMISSALGTLFNR